MCTYRNLFCVSTQGPHHPHVHRDAIMHVLRELYRTLNTQTPSYMHLRNSITHMFSQDLVFSFLILIKYPDKNN